mmetsp:Transcript_42727/g.117959  ORF Transcript_42727/g.117959 Transcript_42727/m.117959 type:complete len:407 (+) Transcript_42727:86-1306(+)
MRERRTPASAAVRHEKRHSAASATSEEQCHPRKIFVGGLAHKTTTQHLRDHFVRFGPVVDAVVLRWPDGRSRGFGYVTFGDAESASVALGQTHQMGGRQVDVKRAVPGTNKLFVGGLPQNTTATELREHFEGYGVVSDAVVMIDPATTRSRGFGFICFLPGQEGAAAVAMALAQYDNHRIRGKWIEVKSASPPHKLAAKDRASTPSRSTADTASLADVNSDEVNHAAARHREEASPHRPQGDVSDSNDDHLGEPRKVALPAPPVGGRAASSYADPPAMPPFGAMLPPPGPCPYPYAAHHAWLHATAAAAPAIAGWPMLPFPGMAAASSAIGTSPAAPHFPSPGALAGASLATAAEAATAAQGTFDTRDVANNVFATPEFHQNLEQLLRQSMPSSLTETSAGGQVAS